MFLQVCVHGEGGISGPMSFLGGGGHIWYQVASRGWVCPVGGYPPIPMGPQGVGEYPPAPPPKKLGPGTPQDTVGKRAVHILLE